MLDIKLIQNNFDTIKEGLIKKKVDPQILEELQKLSLETKEIRKSLEEAQASQNSMSKLFGQYKREGQDTTELSAKVSANKELIAKLHEDVSQAEEKINSVLLTLPNIPDADVPVGADEDDNEEIKKVLTPKSFSFTPKEHWELSEQNGWIDFERGVKLAKSRFSVLAKEGARLERALINYFLDFNRERGFEEMNVPVIVNKAAMQGTGQLPKFADDAFKIEGDELYLIPTAEVPLTNLYADEIIAKDELPIKLTGYTPCFRKEAGSAGRDTRGIIRQHQFDKVELVAITAQEASDAMLEDMVATASDILTSLELPHRIVKLCTGDLGFSAAVTYDIEVWLPGQNKYREISSISNTRDFQARRAKIRYKDEKKNILAHTLNGSSLAVGRTLIAIMENHQNEDGSIDIPKVLEKYL